METTEKGVKLPLIMHDLHDSQMFSIAQAAGRAGIPVEGTFWPMAKWGEKSCYIRRAVELPCLGDQLKGTYALQLKNLGLAGVWLPCVDDMADFTAQYQAHLRKIGMLFITVDAETIQRAFSAESFPETTILKTATTQVISAGDLYRDAEQFVFPMMLKSVRNGFRTFSNATDLRRFLESQDVVEHPDHYHRVQKFIEGDIDRMASAIILFDEESRPVRGFTGKRLRVDKTEFGPFGETTAAKAEWIPELYEGACELLSAMKWKGFAEVECKQDQDGQWYVMEVNPRLSGWSALAEADGAGLIAAYYQMCAYGVRLEEACLQRSKSEYVRLTGTCYHNADWAVEREGSSSLFSQLGMLLSTIMVYRKRRPYMLLTGWDGRDFSASFSILHATLKRFWQIRKFKKKANP